MAGVLFSPKGFQTGARITNSLSSHRSAFRVLNEKKPGIETTLISTTRYLLITGGRKLKRREILKWKLLNGAAVGVSISRSNPPLEPTASIAVESGFSAAAVQRHGVIRLFESLW